MTRRLFPRMPHLPTSRPGPGDHHIGERAEGLVYRVERGTSVELVAKYVRHGKVAGLYLSDHSGAPPVANSWQGGWS